MIFEMKAENLSFFELATLSIVMGYLCFRPFSGFSANALFGIRQDHENLIAVIKKETHEDHAYFPAAYGA